MATHNLEFTLTLISSEIGGQDNWREWMNEDIDGKYKSDYGPNLSLYPI